MRKKQIWLFYLCLVFIFTNHLIAQQSKKVTCTGKVIDSQNQPVAIQATKIDKDTLDDWVKENKISFPVGVIEANEAKTRMVWGVKSLPWLILTDKKHIVHSNGFQLGELENKIQSAQ